MVSLRVAFWLWPLLPVVRGSVSHSDRKLVNGRAQRTDPEVCGPRKGLRRRIIFVDSLHAQEGCPSSQHKGVKNNRNSLLLLSAVLVVTLRHILAKSQQQRSVAWHLCSRLTEPDRKHGTHLQIPANSLNCGSDYAPKQQFLLSLWPAQSGERAGFQRYF